MGEEKPMVKGNKLTRAEQKALRPIQILEAAFEEFVAHGFSATRVEDIAERIGVTKGTVYVYFPTKEDLFSAMIGHISMPLESLLREAAELKGSWTDRLKAYLVLSYERVTQDRKTRELIRFVIAEGARFPQVIDAHHAEVIDPLLACTQELLEEGIAAGEFRASAAANAQIIVAPILALMMDFLIFDNRRTIDVPHYIEAHIDLVLKGILPLAEQA
jgi:AcrR family transcriptional regulator